jgi:hypothetical protein
MTKIGSQGSVNGASLLDLAVRPLILDIIVAQGPRT